MTQERRERPIPQPSFSEVMGLARKRFLEKDVFDPTLPTHPRHGKIESGYSFSIASFDVADALKESGVDMHELSMRMLKETTSNAEDVDWSTVDFKTWDELPVFIVSEIVGLEMSLKFPDLIEEDKRRVAMDEVDIEKEQE